MKCRDYKLENNLPIF